MSVRKGLGKVPRPELGLPLGILVPNNGSLYNEPRSYLGYTLFLTQQKSQWIRPPPFQQVKKENQMREEEREREWEEKREEELGRRTVWGRERGVALLCFVFVPMSPHVRSPGYP